MVIQKSNLANPFVIFYVKTHFGFWLRHVWEMSAFDLVSTVMKNWDYTNGNVPTQRCRLCQRSLEGDISFSYVYRERFSCQRQKSEHTPIRYDIKTTDRWITLNMSLQCYILLETWHKPLPKHPCRPVSPPSPPHVTNTAQWCHIGQGHAFFIS